MGARHVEREHDFQAFVVEFPRYAGECVDAGKEYGDQSGSGGIKPGLEAHRFEDGKFADEQAGANQQHQCQHCGCGDPGAQRFKRRVFADSGDVQGVCRFLTESRV